MGRCETASTVIASVVTPVELCAQIGEEKTAEFLRESSPMFMD